MKQLDGVLVAMGQTARAGVVGFRGGNAVLIGVFHPQESRS